jgi:hypothetical protein
VRRLAAPLALLALLLTAPAASAYLYWTDDGTHLAGNGSTLGRGNLDGSGLRMPFISGAAQPAGVAVDATNIYWSNPGSNSIGRANLDGSSAVQNFIPNAAAAGGHPVQVAIQGSHLYWTDGNRYVGRANLDGTGVQPTFLDTGAGNAPIGLAVTSDTIYVGQQPNEIVRYPIGGGSGTVVANDSTWTLPPLGLTVTGGYVYYTGAIGANGLIGRVLTSAIDDLSPDNSFITGLPLPVSVVTDGAYLYWTDNNTATIGRALIASTSTRQDSFISDPGGPFGLAIDNFIDPTATTVSCTPASVTPGATTTCKATVTDSASSAIPTGLVVFSGNATTPFIGNASSCTLGPDPAGGASCVVGAIPQAAGSAPISAAYQGDPVHAKSSGATAVCVGSAAACAGGGPSGGGGGGGPSGSACVVPKLTGKTLAGARRSLTAAHCALGRVSKPRSLRHVKSSKLVIGRQQPKAGSHLAAGSKVAVTLKRPPRKHSRHH